MSIMRIYVSPTILCKSYRLFKNVEIKNSVSKEYIFRPHFEIKKQKQKQKQKNEVE